MTLKKRLYTAAETAAAALLPDDTG